MNEQLQSTEVQSLLTMVDGMTSTGSTLISETEALSEVLNTTIAGSVNSMMTNGNELMSQMDTLSKGLESYLSGLEAQITNQATQMGTQMAAQVQAWADGAAAQLNQEATAAAQSAADAAASQASADAAKQANDQLSAAAAALDAQISAAKSAGNTELADSLSKARNQIGSVSVSASAGTVSVTPVTAPQITLPELNFEIERPDLSGLAAMQQKMSDIKSQYSDLQKTVAALMPQLSI